MERLVSQAMGMRGAGSSGFEPHCCPSPPGGTSLSLLRDTQCRACSVVAQEALAKGRTRWACSRGGRGQEAPDMPQLRGGMCPGCLL